MDSTVTVPSSCDAAPSSSGASSSSAGVSGDTGEMMEIALESEILFHTKSIKLRMKETVKGWMGVGFMNGEGDISSGEIPFDFLIMMEAIKRLCVRFRQLGRKFEMEILMANVNPNIVIEGQTKKVGDVEMKLSREEVLEKKAALSKAVETFKLRLMCLIEEMGLEGVVKIITGIEYFSSTEVQEFVDRLNLRPSGDIDEYTVIQLTEMAKHQEDGFDFRLSWMRDPPKKNGNGGKKDGQQENPSTKKNASPKSTHFGDEQTNDILFEKRFGFPPLCSIYVHAGQKMIGRKDVGIAVPYSFFVRKEEGMRLTLDPKQTMKYIEEVISKNKKYRKYCLEVMQEVKVGVTEGNLVEEICEWCSKMSRVQPPASVQSATSSCSCSCSSSSSSSAVAACPPSPSSSSAAAACLPSSSSAAAACPPSSSSAVAACPPSCSPAVAASPPS